MSEAALLEPPLAEVAGEFPLETLNPPAPGTDHPDLPSARQWRFTVEQFHKLHEAGVLADDDRVELLEGWLIRKLPVNPPHAVATMLVNDALARVIPAGWHARVQVPVTTRLSELEPDLAVVRRTLRDYLAHHPGPADVGLLVEVSDATLDFDRSFKRGLYARAAVPVYWVVNLPDRRVEVFSGPSGPAPLLDYGQRQTFGPNERVPVALGGEIIANLAVADLLP